MKFLLISIGGALGANARFWLGNWIQEVSTGEFPWGTFLVNISGSFLLGFLSTLLIEQVDPLHTLALRLFFSVGFLGAYTTFSTFEFETFGLAQGGSLLWAGIYGFGSLGVGLVAVWLGILAGKIW